jgi:hypothetical protein
MSDKIKITWPKGSTHLRLVTPEGKKAVVAKGSESSITGVDGLITFMACVKAPGKKPAFNDFAGSPVENPLGPKAALAGTATAAPETAPQPPEQAAAPVDPPVAAPAAPEPTAAQEQPPMNTMAGEPAAPEPKPKKKNGKKSTGPAEGTKGQFIESLIDGKNTAREIADKVVEKFPDKKLGVKAAYEKALRLVRATPAHAFQQRKVRLPKFGKKPKAESVAA